MPRVQTIGRVKFDGSARKIPLFDRKQLHRPGWAHSKALLISFHLMYILSGCTHVIDIQGGNSRSDTCDFSLLRLDRRVKLKSRSMFESLADVEKFSESFETISASKNVTI